MSTPTFNSVSLTTNSEMSRIGSPEARISTASLPAVQGVFVSLFGQGARMIQGGGFLQAGALADLKTLVKAKQAQVAMVVAAYVDTDGVSYSYCILAQYEMAGPVEMQVGGATFRVAVQYQILQAYAG